MPSRGVDAPTAAHKTIVSPYRITQDPSACLATRPTSTVRSRSPTRIDSLRYFLTVIFRSSPSDDTHHRGQARNVSSAALWVDDMECGDLSPLSQSADKSAHSKKRESGRE